VPPPPPENALHEEFETMAEDEVDDDVDVSADIGADGGDADEDGEGDDDAFAELDEALATEAPDKPERRFFRRRSS
jgi:hypothetical protein